MILRYDSGSPFSPKALVFGLSFLLIGVLIVFKTLLGGVLMILIGIGGFSTIKTEIDMEARKVRTYVNFFFTRSGQWESLDKYPDIAVLSTSLGYYNRNSFRVTPGYGDEPGTLVVNSYFFIYLLDKPHHNKIPVGRFTDHTKALAEATRIAAATGRNLTQYNPQLSAASRARRARDHHHHQ